MEAVEKKSQPYTLCYLEFLRTKKIKSNKIWDTALQADIVWADSYEMIGSESHNFAPVNYPFALEFPKYCIAFTLAHFNILSLVLLHGKYLGIYYHHFVFFF